jgi:hypothetical protein
MKPIKDMNWPEIGSLVIRLNILSRDLKDLAGRAQGNRKCQWLNRSAHASAASIRLRDIKGVIPDGEETDQIAMARGIFRTPAILQEAVNTWLRMGWL